MKRRSSPLAVGACALVVALAGCGDAAALSDAPPASRAAVPILMYHHIGNPPAGARLPSLWVRPRELAAQVRALRGAGYRAVTLQHAWDAWHGDATLPRRPVVVSFDDGYASHVRHALPALRRARWPGVLNLSFEFLAAMGGTPAVRRLVRAGWEIDAHGLSHPDLTTLDEARLRRELTEPRARIMRLFGQPANFLAYPYGRYDGRVRRAARDAGYLAATTVKLGFARPADPYALARVRVDRGLGAAGLLRRLRRLR